MNLKTQLTDLLHLARKNFCADSEMKKFLGTPEKDLDFSLSEITQALEKELEDTEISPRNEPPLATGSDVPTIKRSLRQGHFELYVIVPVCNASDDQVADCIHSIVKNFAGTNFCLLVYSNRPLKNIDFAPLNVILFISSGFSLPKAYNDSITFLRETFDIHDEIVVFMDDDAQIKGDQRRSIEENILRIRADHVLAASGHYYDYSKPESFFQDLIHFTHTMEFSQRCQKPYCHGGAALMMRAYSFPANGLPLDGLGGISLNILLTNSADPAKYGGMEKDWFLFNNTSLEVIHPRKRNIVQWSATYLSYELAWGRALSWLDRERQQIWLEKLRKASGLRISEIIRTIPSSDKGQSRLGLGNLLMTKYYKPLLAKSLPYKVFQEYNLKTHVNLNNDTKV